MILDLFFYKTKGKIKEPDVKRGAVILLEVATVCDSKNSSLWIHCPICGGKTRTKVYEDTVFIKFPLYCPKCKKEILVDVVKFKMVLSK